MPPKSIAKDVFEDMGRKVTEISAEEAPETEQKTVEEITSLCMNCHEDGTTRLLLTRIPFFKEIVIMSFSCDHCNFRNTEVQPAGEIQTKGVKFSLKLDNPTDLARQIVKSDTCIFRIEELDLEIPPGRGQLSNVEGIVNMVAEDLGREQEARKEAMPQVYEHLEGIIKTLKDFANGDRFPFRINIDDPAGNSWIEPSTEIRAGKYSRHHYTRSQEQNEALGLNATSEEGQTTEDTTATTTTEAPPSEVRPEYHPQNMYPQMPSAPEGTNADPDDDILENQVYTFPSSCPNCIKPCATNMKMVQIPHFKQVVIMSTVCDHCGYRSNEVKTGGEVPTKGRRITVQVKKSADTEGLAIDLSRDILKSESAAMTVPEIQLAVEPGSQGGRFTTIEGLLTQCRSDLQKTIYGDSEEGDNSASAGPGDSMSGNDREKWANFFGGMDKAINGDIDFTLVLEDPLAASYVQSMRDDGTPDDAMKVEEYERTEQEEEDLGLRDIKTEGYEGDPMMEGKTNGSS